MEQEINVTSVRREQFWQEHMTAWKASGLKQMQYCREHQLSKHAFVYWKLKLLEKIPLPATSFPSVPISCGIYVRGRLVQIRLVVAGHHVERQPGFTRRTCRRSWVLERLA